MKRSRLRKRYHLAASPLEFLLACPLLRRSNAKFIVLLWSFIIGGSLTVAAADSLAQRAEDAFVAARAQFEQAPDSANLAWRLGRAAFDWAEFAKNDAHREKIAKEGIAACRKAIAIQPASAWAHYYLALNLGQLARTKRLSALGIIDEMEQELKIASQLDARLDFAGPHRSLGILYLETPGWPISIGSRANAQLHLQKAVELAPEFPENRLCLAEAYLKWKEKAALQREISALRELWPKAKNELHGPEWEEEWADWTKRWDELRK